MHDKIPKRLHIFITYFACFHFLFYLLLENQNKNKNMQKEKHRFLFNQEVFVHPDLGCIHSFADQQFYKKVKATPGYKLRRRILLDEEVDPTKKRKWIEEDRQHYAAWCAKRDAINETACIQSEKRQRDIQYSIDAFKLNAEFDDLLKSFWQVAPKMFPRDRLRWLNGRFPEYYWSHTQWRDVWNVLPDEEKESRLYFLHYLFDG